MEKVRSIKEQECLKIIQWLDRKYSKPTNRVIEILRTNCTDNREPDSIDYLVGDMTRFSTKNRRHVIFDFNNQTCKWAAYYLLANNQKVHTFNGELAWNAKAIDVVHAYLKDEMKRILTHSIDGIHSRKLKQIRDKYTELQTKLLASQQEEINAAVEEEFSALMIDEM